MTSNFGDNWQSLLTPPIQTLPVFLSTTRLLNWAWDPSSSCNRLAPMGSENSAMMCLCGASEIIINNQILSKEKEVILLSRQNLNSKIESLHLARSQLYHLSGFHRLTCFLNYNHLYLDIVIKEQKELYILLVKGKERLFDKKQK